MTSVMSGACGRMFRHMHVFICFTSIHEMHRLQQLTKHLSNWSLVDISKLSWATHLCAWYGCKRPWNPLRFLVSFLISFFRRLCWQCRFCCDCYRFIRLDHSVRVNMRQRRWLQGMIVNYPRTISYVCECCCAFAHTFTFDIRLELEVHRGHSWIWQQDGGENLDDGISLAIYVHVHVCVLDLTFSDHPGTEWHNSVSPLNESDTSRSMPFS